MDKNKENVPKIRFPGFTDPWEQRKVGELADIVRGASPRPIQDPKWFDIESEVGWLRISDVTEQDGRIYHLEQRISKLGQQKTRVLNEPHLLLSIAATVGKPVINYVKTGVHDGFLIFLKPKFDREFMFQWLEMFRPMWQRYGQPGSQVNLNSDLVKNQKIALPSIEEQVVIGEFLSQFDNLITLHQRKLEHLQDKKKGLLQKMFPKEGEKFPELRFPGFTDPWEQRKLGELSSSFEYGLNAAAKEFDGKNKYIRITDIDDETRLFSTSDITSPNTDLSNAENYILKKGDIVFARTGASVGKSYIYRDSDGLVYYAGFLIRARIKPEYDADFIFQNTLTKRYEKFINIISQRSGQPGVNAQEYATYETLLPKYDEQVKIGIFFNKIDNLITLNQRNLEHLQQQKKGLLQQMFV